MDAEELNATGQVCVDCGVQSPQTNTNYTLISSRYGWRLSLDTLPDGTRSAIWRCPKCWQKFRNNRSVG